MKKRYRRPLAATLFTTAVLGLGALPALAEQASNYATDSSLDSYAADILSGDTFSLTVLPYASGEIAGGFYVGLTHGYLNDETTQKSSDAFYMFCSDFNHEIGLPTTYSIVIESLAGPTDPPDPPPGLNESLLTLQTQALLGANFGGSPSGNAAADGDIQFTIWNLNSPPAGFPTNPNMVAMLAAAQAAQPTSNFSGAYLFDIINPPPGPAAGQAFMPVDLVPFHNSTEPPTPEPGTLAMLGLGLLGLGTLKLRRRS